MTRLTRFAAAFALAALAGCGNEAEMNALKTNLARVQQEADFARQDLAKAKQGLDAAKAALADAEKAGGEARKGLEAATVELAKTREEIQASRAAQDTLRKEKDDLSAGLAQAKQEAEAARKAADIEPLQRLIAELKGRVQELERQVAAKDQEIAQAKGAAPSAQSLSAAEPAAFSTRLAYSGSEPLGPSLLLPVTFMARKGEILKWSWTVANAPSGLVADAIDFSVVGPDQTRAYSTQGGWQKKEDRGSFAATADGRWTVVWTNRHPAEPFTIQYEATLTPAP